MRATLEADLRWRDPERYDDVRVRISVASLQAVRAAAEDDALHRVAEWMFLFRHQGGQDDLYNGRAHPHVEDTPLRPEDVPGVLRMAEEAEGPASAAAVAHWVRRQLEAFRVYRYAGAATPVSFMAILRLDAPLPEDRAEDPVIAAVWDLVEAAAPLGPGEHLGIRRFAVHPGGHQRPSPLMELISRRTIGEEMRTRGRAVTFTAFEDAGLWGRYLAGAGLPEVAAVDVGGRRQHVFGRDWRRQTVEQWVRHRARAAVAPVATWPATASTSDQLPRAAFEEGVLEALRTWHTPREFATSVLLHSHLVPPGSPDPVADLRDAITTALDALRIDSAGVKAHEALTATYIAASRTHRRLGVPLAVVSAGVGCPRPTRLLADWVAEAVCRSLAAGGARAEVEVLEPHRLAADLAQQSEPVPTIVVAGPADRQATATGDARRLRACIDQAAAELAAAMHARRS
ncbi:hypothetical protein [Actinophytocola sp.]|uniref:hypothetical protein n=1 Tax=Actinophytocola sp. TaxID=1872138 RepID=UPI00389A6268